MKVVIVDDEPAARRTLREYCTRAPGLQIVAEFSDSRAALAAIIAQPPDLLFLDIQMDSLTGLALARELDPKTMPMIVFVTAYDHHALEAFEVNATDYLLKPFDEERFQKTLERVMRRSHELRPSDRPMDMAAAVEQLQRYTKVMASDRPRLLAELGGRMQMLDVAQIELIEADRNYVNLTVGRDHFQVRSTLAQAEKSLLSQPMLRISRSCLVNINHLREVSRTPRGDFILVLNGGKTVTSSEGFRDAVRDYIGRLKIGSASVGQ